MPDRPLLLCYDGSDDAKHAIAEAASLMGSRPALVVSVWQDAAAIPSFAWVGAATNLDELMDAARESTEGIAAEGVELAEAAGLKASPLVVEARGPVWEAIVEVADKRDASAIVLGSRGLSGIKGVLLGSVSGAVVHHANRPALVVRRVHS